MADASNDACVVVGEPPTTSSRQACELVDVGWLADREHHGDPLGQQAPRHERPASARRPDRAIAHRRPGTRAAATSAARPAGSGRQGDEEAIGSAPSCSPNATRSASRCGPGSAVESVEHGRAQLMQPGEGELHLGLTPATRTMRHSDACSATYSSSADLPTPASPRRTCTELSPPDALQLAVSAARTVASASQHPRLSVSDAHGAPTGQPAGATRESTGDLPGREPARPASRLAAMSTTRAVHPHRLRAGRRIGDEVSEVLPLVDTVFVAGRPSSACGQEPVSSR
jgi:hypothetical protein